MKTLEELYNEVMASEELKKEFGSLKPEEVEGFAEKHGCKATLDEIKAFLTEKSTAEGEVSEEEVDQIAGGKTNEPECWNYSCYDDAYANVKRRTHC